jgi:hypothetical protein
MRTESIKKIKYNAPQTTKPNYHNRGIRYKPNHKKQRTTTCIKNKNDNRIKKVEQKNNKE